MAAAAAAVLALAILASPVPPDLIREAPEPSTPYPELNFRAVDEAFDFVTRRVRQGDAQYLVDKSLECYEESRYERSGEGPALDFCLAADWAVLVLGSGGSPAVAGPFFTEAEILKRGSAAAVEQFGERGRSRPSEILRVVQEREARRARGSDAAGV